MIKSSSPSPAAPPPSPTGTPVDVIYLEWTKGKSAWGDTTSVDITVDGYIRKEYRVVQLVPRGWQIIQADGDLVAKGALVIDIVEVASEDKGNTPRTFYVPDNFSAPKELRDALPADQEVVLCGYVPGPDVDTPPVTLGMMKKTRIKVPGTTG